MSKVFEDEFMELQSGLIALSIEATEGKVDKIFAYCSNEKNNKMFNAFFEVDGELKKLHQLNIPDGLIQKFLYIGTQDVVTLDAIGKKYNRRVPTELKLYYDVKSGRFDAKYQYDPVCVAEMGISQVQVYHDWISEVKEEYGLK